MHALALLSLPPSRARASERGRALASGLALGLAVLGASGCGPRSDYVQFHNGFDFDVTAKISSGEGKEQSIVVPARGRVDAGLSGKHSIEFSSPTGPMKTQEFDFGEAGEQKDGCFAYVNVLGSAAIVESDVSFGIDIQSPDKLRMGSRFFRACPRWGFDETPPQSVTVDEGTMGLSKTWLHYAGEGDWVTSVDTLLAAEPQVGDQDRIMAWNIAATVHKHDPENPKLAPLGPKFLAACDRIVDTFTTGPMAGQAAKKCKRNTKALFGAK